MTLDRAIEHVNHTGGLVIPRIDGLMVVPPVGKPSTFFPIHFEPSPRDGFPVAHVDGRQVIRWACGRR